MAEAKLYYFNCRGFAERIRIILRVAGIKFEESLLTERAHMKKLLDDGVLQFGQIPLLEIDGLRIVQANACVRYVASKANMNSTDPKIQSRIDSLYYGAEEFMQIFFAPHFLKPVEDCLTQAKEKVMPRYLPIFEKALKDNGTGFLVGNKVTMADALLLEPLFGLLEYFGEEPLKEYPNIKNFLQNMKSLDGVRLYLEKYRKQPNNQEVKTEIFKVLEYGQEYIVR